MTCTLLYPSPVGKMRLTERDGALTGLSLEGQRGFAVPSAAADGTLSAAAETATPLLARTAAWLDRYFAGKKPDAAELPLAPSGSAFREIVWRLLLEIPYGETTTYGALTRQVAALTGRKKMSAQAVGGAVGHNPISVIIPCHRVIGSDGTLTGYDGGLALKAALLAHEGATVKLPCADPGNGTSR